MTKRDYKTGGLRQRGENTWELKVRMVDPNTGRRVTRYQTFKGSRQAAKVKLSELQSAAVKGSLPDERRLFGSILDAWEQTLDVSPKTKERYLELVRLHVRPHLGDLKVRSITPSRLEQFYSELRKGRNATGADALILAPRTVGHIHRLVLQAMKLAERDRAIDFNPARLARPPKVESEEVQILSEEQARAVVTGLKGRSIFPIVLLALGTGMRRGEILGLRWKDINFEKSELRVQQSIEQTKGDTPLRIKSPKTVHGRRTISLAPSLVGELRALRKKRVELRLGAGAGKLKDDALVFCRDDEEPLMPNSVTTEWRRLTKQLKLPAVSFHALRHTHASQLIDAGRDVVQVSRRLGHSSPAITLKVYAHLFKPADAGTVDVFEAAFGRSVTE